MGKVTVGSSVQGTDALITSGPSQWWEMQPGPDRDQTLLDAQLLGEDTVWRSQTFLLALEELVASSSSPLSPPLQAPATRPSSQPPPSPSQGLAARPSPKPSPPLMLAQLAPIPNSVSTIQALLAVCPYKLQTRNCPRGIGCTMKTPCEVCLPLLSSPVLTVIILCRTTGRAHVSVVV